MIGDGLDAVRASLDEARNNVAPDDGYCASSWALQALDNANQLLAEVARLTAERDEALRQVERQRERRLDAVREMAEVKTTIGHIWHALGIPADADADIVAEVRELRARDKPGCSRAHEELAEVEAKLARQESAVKALRVLVKLKDGPRDSAYYRDREPAWRAARDALAATQPTVDIEPEDTRA